MNSSLRTAFWALCLSLALPMAMFVGVEIWGGARPAPKVAEKIAKPQAANATAVKEVSQFRGSLAPRNARTVADSLPRRSAVTLGPQLEPDEAPAAPRSAGRTALVDPSPPATARPGARFHVLESSPASGASTVSQRIEAQLTKLQQNVDQLAQVQQNQSSQAQQKQQTDQQQQMMQLLQQLQQANQLQSLQQQLQNLKQGGSGNGGEAPAEGTPPEADPAAKPQATEEKSKGKPGDPEPAAKPNEAPRTPGVLKATRADDGSERFSLNIKDAEISEVLEMIGQLSNQNILASKDVTGRVTANLHLVNLDQALSAILKSGGYVFEREGEFIFVSSAAEVELKTRQNRKLVTKVYRPHYISVKDLKALVTPLLTPIVGKVAVTNPSEVGIATSGEAAGGDSLSQRDALLVLDYAEVLAEVDHVLLEMDIPPMQVVIEATILSVTLNDQLKMGVNFALLGGADNQLVVSGNGQTLNGTVGAPGRHAATVVPPVGEFIANTAGLKYGFIRGDIGMFISALENIADTNLVATPQLMVLNKQRAELHIGDRLSYTTLAFNGTQTVQNVNFLDAGTKLRLRPFIAPDGYVRMEIHPEKSSATIDTKTNLPNVNTTEVTTNVMVRDGTTVVIGGLIDEIVQENYDRVPFLGALPLVGAAFRNKFESIVRRELIVLITPRIVQEGELAASGEAIKFEHEQRANFFRDNLAPINRRNLSRMQFDNAKYHYERGNLFRARQSIRESLMHNKNDLAALQLKDTIEQAIDGRAKPWLAPPPPGLEVYEAMPLDEAHQPLKSVPDPGQSVPAGMPALKPPLKAVPRKR